MVARMLGHYEIIEPLGAGGMGEVYRARDPRLDRDVAIKVLPEDLAADAERLPRFEREAKLLAQLNHANIAGIYGLEDAAGVRFIAMEYVEGETLAAKVANVGRIELDEALEIARQIAEALEAAHEAGIVHRDLKPANVVVTPAGNVKVLDFGLAKAWEGEGAVSGSAGGTGKAGGTERTGGPGSADGTGGTADLSHSPTMAAATRTGVILGTAAYMSPEQARGKPVDKRADIWAFGALLYEMLTGEPAFGGHSITDVLAAVVKEEPDWDALPRGLPWRATDVIRSCLEKDPRRRLHHIADARIGLEKSTEHPPTQPGEPSRGPWRLAAGWLALTAALLGVAIWATYVWTIPDPPLPVRTNVSIPVGERFPEWPTFAMAPDGSAYVYGTGTQDFADRLHLRSVSRLAATPVPGTERAWFSFFKPDGESIAFVPWGSTELRIVSLDGAPPIALVDDAFEAGGWGRDGYIYYTRAGDRGLSRVPEGGGLREDLTSPDFVRSGKSHNTPHVLPPGNGVVFTVYDFAAPERSEIAAYSFATGEVTPLFPGMFARYVHSGHLVYTTADGAIHAVRFDPDRLEPLGSSIRLNDRIAPRPGGVFSISEDGTLLYPVPRPRSGKLVRVDRAGRETALGLENAQYRQVALSPDAVWAAAEVSDPESLSDDIWVIELATDERRRLTLGGEHEDVGWTADGQRVLFSSAGSDAGDIYWAPANGAGVEEPLLVAIGIQYEPAASADGRLLFWREGDLGDDDTTLFFAPMESLANATPLAESPYKERSPTLSPDGRWLAYVSDENGAWEVYVQPFPGTGGARQVSRGGGSEPRWARDSSELFYRNDQGMWTAPIRGDGSGITGQLLFPERGEYRRDASHPTYDVFPDGSFLMIRKDSADYDLVLVQNFFAELERLVSRGR